MLPADMMERHVELSYTRHSRNAGCFLRLLATLGSMTGMCATLTYISEANSTELSQSNQTSVELSCGLASQESASIGWPHGQS